jgi:hypothetical protein
MSRALWLISAPSVGLATLVQAAVTPIGPFTGDHSDALDYPGTTIVSQFSILDGTASLNSHDGNTLIHYLLGDTFGVDHVSPRTGEHILGFTEGPGVFLFDPPVRRFGAYFNNNSGADDATCDFFGAHGEALGTLIATTPAPGDQWVWNGWESDTPIARLVVTGNGVIDGFLWFDDFESSVPGPDALLVLLAGAGVMGRRRRGER